MVFVDGLGIGVPDPEVNPLACFRGRILSFFQGRETLLPFAGRCIPTDPTLGMEGLPQSATGQVSLYTGQNAALPLGGHLQGFPNRELRILLGKHSLFRRLADAGFKTTFANAYTPRFFEDRPRWVSATTAMCESAGIRLRTIADLLQGQALFMDFSNKWLIERGFEVPLRSGKEAALILSMIARAHDFCLYEYFLTDLAGHRFSLGESVELAAGLDDFLYELVAALDLAMSSLIICSDHGNLEDKSIRLHTRNPVPTLVWGPLKEMFPDRPILLQEIAPRLAAFLEQSACIP